MKENYIHSSVFEENVYKNPTFRKNHHHFIS